MEDYIYTNYYAVQKSLNCWFICMDHDTDPYGQDPNRVKKHDEWFTPEEAAQVEGMTLWHGLNTLERDESAYDRYMDMSIFTNLKYLCIPHEIMKYDYIDISSIAQKLEHMRILSPSIMGGGIDFSVKRPRFTMFDTVFPLLKTLYIYASPRLCSNFSIDNYPQLRWFATDYEEDENGIALKLFKEHPTIQGFGINSVRRKHTLKYLRNNVSALYFWSIRTKGLDFKFIESFENIKYLQINASATTVDCSILSTLPSLAELTISTCACVLNIESLLQSRSLEKFKFNMNCTKITPELKEQMDRKFVETDIWL